MARPSKSGENTKKAAGNAKKAEVAAQKKAVEDSKKAKEEEQKWQKGAKDTSKQAAAEEKAAEAARKKAEKEALLKEEEASLPSKPKGAGTKTAQKKTKGPDLSQLDAALGLAPGTTAANGNNKGTALNATGIDNALDALSLTTKSGANDKVERHPERRFKAAYTAYEERRLEEMKDDKSLRRQQKVEQIRKEFEKSPENPFNQSHGTYDMTKEELSEFKEQEREKKEKRLASPS